MPTSQTSAPSRPVQESKPAVAPRRRSLLLTAVDCVVAGAVVLVGLEILFTFAGVGQEEFLQYDESTGVAPMPGREITFRSEGFSRSRFNSFGMRDKELTLAKPAGTIRVAMLGDSLTESVQVNREQSFPYLLEKKLETTDPERKFEVMNFGVGSFYLPQKYLRLKDLALKFKPDLAIIELRTGETLELMPKPLGNLVTARPCFFVDGEEKLVENRTFQNQWNGGKEAKRLRALHWLRRHSSLYGMVGTTVQRIETWKASLGKSTTKKNPEPKKTESAGKRKVVNFAFSPIDPYLKRLTKALILQAKQDCEKQNCKLALMYVTALGTLKHDQEEIFLTECAKEVGVPMLNLHKPIEDNYFSGSEPLNWSHFAPRGHRLLADELLAFVKQNFPALVGSEKQVEIQKVSVQKEHSQNAL